MHYIRNLLVRQLLWMARQNTGRTLAPANADPFLLGAEGMSSRLFYGELFVRCSKEDDYRQNITEPLWHAASGVLERKEDTCCLLPANGSRPISICPNCCSRLQDYDNEEPVVLLYDRKNPDTGEQILVTKAEYRLTNPYPSVYDKACMLQEYLKLDLQEQEIVFSFLTNKKYTKTVFANMCSIALKACQIGSNLSDRPTVVWNESEEGFFLEQLGFFDAHMEKDLWILCILLAVWELVRIFEKEGDSCARKELLRADACCRHSCLAEAVGRILPSGKAEGFARMLLSADSEMTDVFDFARTRFWLFALLENKFPLSRGILQDICCRYFDHPMTARLLRSLRSSLFSSNAEVLREYIETMYPEKYALPSGGFPAALAVIRIHDMQYQDELVRDEAQRLMLEGNTDADVLLGIAMLTVHLLFFSEHIRSHREPVLLSRETEVTTRVLAWLQEPLGIHYPDTCALVHQLCLNCAVSEDAFADPRVIQDACRAWNDHIRPTIVEKMVSILPLGITLSQNDALTKMRLVLGKRFDEAILAKTETEDLVSLFRACMVLGCWEKDFLLRRFGYLLREIDGKEKYKSWERREYMRRLKWEMLHIMIRREEAVSGGLDRQITAVDADQGLAGSLLRIFRRSIFQKSVDLSRMKELAQSRGMNLKEPRLITDWFYVLCAMGLDAEAEDFYLRHKDVLNRPWTYFPDAMGLAAERPYHAASCFWNNKTRREKGLEIAAEMGYPVQEWTLAQKHRHDIYRMRQYIPRLSPDRDRVLSWFRTLYRSGIRNYWLTHYDDTKVTQNALAETQNHGMILLFGYCGSKEMVMEALKVKPSHVCYASKALLKDDQVAKLVLEQSCQNLPLLFAPITRDHEYMKNLILMQKEPVVLNRTREWIRDDKELMIPSVETYPQYFEQVSERLRGDREVVLAALKGAILSTSGTYWLRHILRNAAPELLKDPAIIECVKERFLEPT